MTEIKTENKCKEAIDHIFVRSYNAKDLAAVRKISCETAYFGDSCDTFFPDRDLLADILINYYAVYEPENLWVAEFRQEVVGYLTGCADTLKYDSVMTSKIVPTSLLRSLFRGSLWDKRTKEILLNIPGILRSEEVKLPQIDREKYPIHLHFNVKKEWRGKRVGTKLFEMFLSRIEVAGKKGIGFRALRQEPVFPFFEKKGFKKTACNRAEKIEMWLGKSPLYYMCLFRDA